ncbi:Competence protein ComM [Commensalibacter sp. Nvir]|uniref:YifB family Mg chelatase-like AAA ATPase n=1 Tax=Commensalibacter sp. Nvir TaxID=3069817 RepID=UPI002D63ED35|nr:Competence protein ComM [Commensalibacter sp. Nvir]
MSITRVNTFAFSGIDPIPVEVQVQISRGLPAFIIVGLADKAVTESRERVKAALTSMGLALPPKRILVNLAPADILKEGTHYDLPIAVGILSALEIIPEEEVFHYVAIGELSLDGQICPVNGVISATIGSSQLEKGLICPHAQGSEALLGGDIDILAAKSLLALIQHFKGQQILIKPAFKPIASRKKTLDLSEVKGMESTKRALEIAAAGGHSMLMVGPPGCGKSMVAHCMTGLLPDLTLTESLETTRIYSSAGLLSYAAPIQRPPFRAPHHSASAIAITGGGTKVKPGEISLAHHGVLFLDELPEFSRNALESLRQPLETGTISIARATSHITYPAKFQLLAAMNPCRCGYLGDIERECHRIPRCKEEYWRKISGPLLDRIDIIAHVESISSKELTCPSKGEKSESIAIRVKKARKLQYARQNTLNNELSSVQFKLNHDVTTMIENASMQLRLSNRGMLRLLRVAQTIADLDHLVEINVASIAEALNFRQR